MKKALLGTLVIVMVGGCALVAGLEDREPPDTTEGGTSDGGPGSDVDGTTGTDGGVPDGSSAETGSDANANEAGLPIGVACGSSICDASVGCCLDAGVCGELTSCVGQHASCDGPEDCPSTHCCSSGPGSLCNSGGCGAYICHTDDECTRLSPSEPHCCPATTNPYRVCSSVACL